MVFSTRFSRRTLLKASAATAVLGGISAPHVARAQSAEFTYKYANNLPDTHPLNVRAKEMAAAIKAETNGKFDLQIFPNNQLGSDTDMLSQIRSGGVEFFTLSGLILSTLVPAASINGIGFAFPDYDTVWKAMDGDLGAHVREETGAIRAENHAGQVDHAQPRQRLAHPAVSAADACKASASFAVTAGSGKSRSRRPTGSNVSTRTAVLTWCSAATSCSNVHGRSPLEMQSITLNGA